MSNKKLKIQYQKHPHFDSLPPLHPPKNPEPSVIFVATFRFYVTKDYLFSFTEFQQLT